MKNSSLGMIKDVSYTLTIIALSVSLIVLVSWSGGVLNDIKNFDIKKHGDSNNSLSVYSDSNISEVFRFSENKIVSGYTFFHEKLVELKGHVIDQNYSVVAIFVSDDKLNDNIEVDTTGNPKKDVTKIEDKSSKNPQVIEPSNKVNAQDVKPSVDLEINNNKKKINTYSMPFNADVPRRVVNEITNNNKKDIK